MARARVAGREGQGGGVSAQPVGEWAVWSGAWPRGRDRRHRRRTDGAVRERGERGIVSGIFVNNSKFKIQFTELKFFSLFLASNEKVLHTIFVQFFEIYNFHFRHCFI